MGGEIDWRLVENSNPENGKLGEVIRWLERFCGGNSSFDWKESRRRCVAVVCAELI